MIRRYVIVAELDDDTFNDQQRDHIVMIGQHGREQQILSALTRDLPGLTIKDVSEVAHRDVVFQ